MLIPCAKLDHVLYSINYGNYETILKINSQFLDIDTAKSTQTIGTMRSKVGTEGG